ncbi:MAG: NAAT family transporter [Gammaproteobacteria bacterium]|nr:MAG: NAAT family transporter [Gammaproteobacteria bacterium]
MDWSDIAAAAVTLFLVMDPLGNAPVFNAILSRFETRQRARIVIREMFFALAIALVFLFAGTAITEFLGLSQSSLNIAGGTLLFIIALRMIFPGRAADDPDVEEDPFIVPLAMPLVAGPSTLAILMLLSSRQPERIWEWATALVIAWSGTTVLLAVSPFLLKVLGRRGARALERFMGMLLVLLAVQMLLNGIGEFMRGISGP